MMMMMISSITKRPPNSTAEPPYDRSWIHFRGLSCLLGIQFQYFICCCNQLHCTIKHFGFVSYVTLPHTWFRGWRSSRLYCFVNISEHSDFYQIIHVVISRFGLYITCSCQEKHTWNMVILSRLDLMLWEFVYNTVWVPVSTEISMLTSFRLWVG